MVGKEEKKEKEEEKETEEEYEKIERCVEIILKNIGDKTISRDEIKKELIGYLTRNVSHEKATYAIIDRYLLSKFPSDIIIPKNLSEVGMNEQNLELLCRVLFVNSKEIGKNESKKKILYGIVADSTGFLSFTHWEPESVQIEKGDVFCIRYAHTGSKQWLNKPQLSFDGRTKFEKQPDDLLPMENIKVLETCKVNDLRENMYGVSVVAKILSLSEKKIVARGEEKTVYSGILADDTGKILFSAWEDFGLRVNDVVKIVGGHTKSWKGLLQLNFDSTTYVEKVDEKIGLLESVDKIEDIEKKMKRIDVTIEGFVVDIRKDSGVVTKCPICQRVINDNYCSQNGKVEGVRDLRIKAVIDDGSATLVSIFNRTLTEKLLNITLETATPPQIKEAFERLYLSKLWIRGNIKSDEYGLTMIVTDCGSQVIDVCGRAKSMLEEIERTSVKQWF